MEKAYDEIKGVIIKFVEENFPGFKVKGTRIVNDRLVVIIGAKKD